jgi:hypothetical protein
MLQSPCLECSREVSFGYVQSCDEFSGLIWNGSVQRHHGRVHCHPAAIYYPKPEYLPKRQAKAYAIDGRKCSVSLASQLCLHGD